MKNWGVQSRADKGADAKAHSRRARHRVRQGDHVLGDSEQRIHTMVLDGTTTATDS